MNRAALVFALLGATAFGATIAEKTAEMKKLPGFFTLYWDQTAGKLWMEVDRWDAEFLYVRSIPAGIGSNDIGIDRGSPEGESIVRFERSGPKVLLVEPNYRHRASSKSAAERRTVEESFARSVLWGFEAAAEENGRVLIDATPFFVRDAHNVAATLKETKQGEYKFEQSRSAIYLPNTRNFPKNTEVEATVTLTGEPAGEYIRDVAPDPRSVTVREHFSFVELPGPGFETREFDPRGGVFAVEYVDNTAPIGEPIVKRMLARHRLKKKDPAAAISEPVQPIVYYLDPGAPEPARSALLEGARWWSRAFEAAGFRNAFRVELLPEGADPMDIRYNVINWVHRATRGWSYGSSVIDPRTGEIMKGQVTLGSLRVRQDYLIAEAVLAPYAADSVPQDMLAMSLARLRQLAAHEVGHTLGLAHNFAASTRGRSSVMDYPHPLIELSAAGVPELSNAYAAGVGDWDTTAITYAYKEYPPGADVKAESDKLLRSAAGRGLLFISDADARPQGSAHALAHLWDNGADPVTELERMMKVRAAVLARFGERNIRPGQPMSSLEDVLVPAYLLHRYQTEAAAKVLGGARYRYSLRGDGQPVLERAPAGEQRRALTALLATVSPDALTLPARILQLIPPPAFGYSRSREDFRGSTGRVFDPLGAAEAAANLSIGLVLNPERAARLVEDHAADPAVDGLAQVIDALLAATWRAAPRTGMAGAVQRTTDSVALFHLMSLASNADVPEPVRGIAFSKLRELRGWLERTPAAEPQMRALGEFAAAQIKRFEENPKEVNVPKPAEPPPGQPIGCGWEL
jgi:hypothetical protein